MSTLVKYYQSNQEENPYTMESFKDTSRVSILISLIAELAPKGAKILDVGCGDMYLSKVLPDYKWSGIDVAKAKGAVIHDLEAPPYPFKAESFDMIICSEVLEHVFDPVKVTKEIHRLLKPDGSYILSTPNADFIDHFIHHFEQVIFDVRKSWTKEHIHLYNKQSHQQILDTCGFKMESYTGADAQTGVVFTQAFLKLEAFLIQFYMTKQKATDATGHLMGEMFKDFAHTIVITARKK